MTRTRLQQITDEIERHMPGYWWRPLRRALVQVEINREAKPWAERPQKTRKVNA